MWMWWILGCAVALGITTYENTEEYRARRAYWRMTRRQFRLKTRRQANRANLARIGSAGLLMRPDRLLGPGKD
jgi:hypothetical protein